MRGVLNLHNLVGGQGVRFDPSEGFVVEPSLHPSAELRAAYGLGNLAPGAALAVMAHLEGCSACSRALDPPAARLWALDPFDTLDTVRRTSRRPPRRTSGLLQTVLKLGQRGPWRWAGLGARSAELGGVSGLGEAVVLVELSKGAVIRLPAAAEILLVLAGGVELVDTTAGLGDFVSLPGDWTRIRAQGADGAVCLLVGDGELHQRPWLDWLRGLRSRAA